MIDIKTLMLREHKNGGISMGLPKKYITPFPRINRQVAFISIKRVNAGNVIVDAHVPY